MLNMDAETFGKYVQAITYIEGQNMLLDMQVADYPYLKRDDRKKLHSRLTKKSFPQNEETKKFVSTEEAFKFLNTGIQQYGR